MLAKQLSFLANADSAGLVLGARVPIILTSRADSVRSRIASCAVAMLVAHATTTTASARHVTMDDYAVVLNAGSSSLKFSVYRRPEGGGWLVEARGQIEGIGTSPHFSASERRGRILADQALDATVRDARAALDALAAWLGSRYGGARVSASATASSMAGRRSRARRSSRRRSWRSCDSSCRWPRFINPTTWRRSTRCRNGFRTCRRSPASTRAFTAASRPSPTWFRCRARSAAPACSATAFTACRTEYVASMLPQVAPDIAKGRVIVAHLGSGASLCALKNGKSVDSSLGFTALDGLCMGTRPGTVDPGVVLYLFQTLGLSAKEVETILYKKSGLLGISGLSNDMRDLLAQRRAAAKLAVDYFVYRAAKEIGALAAVLGGMDGLVFTAGIGENSAEIRRRICDASAWLGIETDEDANARNGPRISAAGSRVAAWVIPTNEELMIARHTGVVLGLLEARSP